MSDSLFMVRVPFRGQRLFELAKRRGLKTYELDLGYASHCALRELFGVHAPQPFALQAATGGIQPVLGYSHADTSMLRESARLSADPWLWEHLVDWENLATKPLPTTWREGQVLDFSVRTTPIARAAKDHPHHRAGSEVDVFLLACRQHPVGPDREFVAVDREAVYRDWVQTQLERHGSVSLDRVKVESYQLERLSRRHHAENVRKTLQGRPEVTFSGTLTIRDPQAFPSLLARGIGRHRAFGFGMILLRPTTR